MRLFIKTQTIEQDDISYQYRYISRWIEYQPEGKLHPCFCSNCGRILFQYSGNVILEMPGLTPNLMPLVIQCKNDNCRTRYNIIGYVKRDNSY